MSTSHNRPPNGRAPSAEDRFSYWRERLKDAGRLELPTDTPRRADQDFVPAVWSQSLPASLVERLRTLADRHGVSFFITVLAAYQVLLHRYSGVDDIAVGSSAVPIDARSDERSGSTTPQYLVLRTDCSDDPRFCDLLARVRDVVLDAGTHAVSIDELIEAGVVDGDVARRYLFDVTFARSRVADSHDRPFELRLVLQEGANGRDVSLAYNQRLYDRETAARMVGHLQTLLQGGAADPNERLSMLPLLTTAERVEILVEWNRTRTAFPEGRCLHELAEDHARSAPGDTAVIWKDTIVTYAEVNRRANQLAHQLRSMELGPDRVAGICVERSPDMVAGVLGILKAGAAYLPLDPAYPEERLTLMLADAEVPVIVTQPSLVEKFRDYRGRLIQLDADSADGQLIGSRPTESPPGLATPHNLAYVIYTSGSSGRPKGVLLDHRGRVNNFTDFNRRFSVGPGDRILAVSSLGFDMSAYDILGTLAAGGTIVLPAASDERDPAHWADLMVRHRVTIWHSAPALLGMLVDHISGRPHLWPKDLRLVLLGGDWIPLDLPERLKRLVGGVDVISLGGATEVSMDSTIYEIHEVDPSWRSIPYGRPMANQLAYVLDEFLQPVPVGVPGQLHLGGVGVARGYLNNPGLTAGKFVPNPFCDSPGDRLYQTGDLARYRPDGNLELLGRLDQQVKIRGNRVEIGEITTLLKKHPYVDQVAVVATGDTSATKRLVAYVVPDLDQVSGDSNAFTRLNVEHVEQWRAVYDETYRGESTQSDPTFNVIGWNSSYTGLPIPDEEMSEWVDTTVRRVLDLKPRRVLEIGCGTGLILFRVAPTCTSYSGIDISTVALEGIRRQLDLRQVALPQVTLSHRAAHELGEFEPNAFDTVILNSVTQLFPSVAYLLDVLGRVVDLVEPGGRVFVGDVRSLPHLEMLHTSIQLFQSPGSLPRERLRARVKKSLAQEEQLVVAPEFFFALADHLPKIGRVGLQLRAGWHHNELTRFRYDVVLEIGERIEPKGDVSVLDWSTDDVGLVGIRQFLSERSPAALILRGVPNARLSAEVRMLDLVHDPEGPPTVADVRRELKEVHKGGAVDPEEIFALAGDHPYEIQVAWADSGELGACDVTFTRRADRKVGSRLVPPPGRFPFSPKPWSQYANRPVLGKAAQTLPPRLRAFLAERLPDYMVPSAFVLLDALPLSPNGKVDVRALQPPDATRPPLSEPYVAPLNQVEEAIAGIWGDVLGIERVGRHDQFLELGGHSLLAMQVASRLRGLFSLELSLGSVLSSPTVAVLASYVQRAGERAGIDAREIARRAVRGDGVKS